MSQPSHSAKYYSEADIIEQLPTDQSVPSRNEIHVVNTLFKENKGNIHKIFNELKSSVLIGLLFMIFSLPQIDVLIKKCIVIADKSPYILIGIKAFIFVVVFYFLNNMYLVRN